MFILRKIEEVRDCEGMPFEQTITNFELGDSYKRLRKGTTREFSELLISKFPETNESEISSIIRGQNGWDIFVLNNEDNKKYSYFIMTDSGKTFERL